MNLRSRTPRINREQHRPIWPALMMVMSAISGCQSGVRRADVPDVSPSAAAAAAVEQYDADGNGELSHDELAACPGILSVVAKYDKDNDGQVTADEIAARIQYWRDAKVAILSLPCIVTLDGAPLAGAEMKFVPERYLGESVLPASGTTDERGYAEVAIAADALPADMKGIHGVHCGTYKIQITHPTQQIPAKYNTATVLGHETSLDNHVLSPKQFALTSR